MPAQRRATAAAEPTTGECYRGKLLNPSEELVSRRGLAVKSVNPSAATTAPSKLLLGHREIPARFPGEVPG